MYAVKEMSDARCVDMLSVVFPLQDMAHGAVAEIIRGAQFLRCRDWEQLQRVLTAPGFISLNFVRQWIVYIVVKPLLSSAACEVPCDDAVAKMRFEVIEKRMQICIGHADPFRSREAFRQVHEGVLFVWAVPVRWSVQVQGADEAHVRRLAGDVSDDSVNDGEIIAVFALPDWRIG